MTMYKFLRWMRSKRWMDERVVTSKKSWNGIEEKMPLVENLTCLNALEGKFWKINPKILMDEKRWKTCKSDQKIVMNEELVQNGVMNEESVQNGVMDGQFVKNFVMDAKIDPKVVMDLSKFKNWWMEQFATQ